MYYVYIPVPIYLVLIGLYLVARNDNDLKGTTIIQPALTILGDMEYGMHRFRKPLRFFVGRSATPEGSC